MTNIKRENAVRNLSNLYTVVIGVALSLAVRNTVDASIGLQSISMVSILLFVAFSVTVFPFYHGALRHLDDTYVETSNPEHKDGALIIDVLLLLFHGIGFVLLSQLLKVPNEFAWVLLVLLMIDVIWGIFVHFSSSTSSAHAAEWKWTIINSVAVLIGSIYLISNDIYLEATYEPVKLSVLTLLLCVGRTIVDYVWGRNFYFPKN